MNSDSLWGYLDKIGKIVIPYQFAFATQFAEGVAFVIKGSAGYLINKEGLPLVQIAFERVGVFSEGLAPFKNADKYGFMDGHGKIVIRPRFSSVRSFREGLAAVGIFKSTSDPMLSEFGFIDHDGKLVIELKYADALDFHEGLAAVYEGAGWTYINKKGEPISHERFAFEEDFHGGLAKVGIGIDDPLWSGGERPVYGYIDKSGKHIWEPSE